MSEKVTVKVERNILHLPAIALRGLVVFPNNLLHFEVGRDKSIAAVEWAVRNKSEVFLIAQKDMKAEDPKAEEMYQYGVVAEIKQVMRVSDDLVRILVEGKFRAKRTELDTEGSFLLASVRPAPVRPIKAEEETVLRNVKTSFDAVLSMNPRISKDVVFAVTSNNDPAFLCEYIPANLLSLGAIDFGIIVDGTIVMMETILKKREDNPGAPLEESSIAKRAAEVAKPILFATLIIMVAYMPLFAFDRVEQKLFTPMAFTLCFALVGALASALILIPGLAFSVYHKPQKMHRNRWLERLTEGYKRQTAKLIEAPKRLILPIVAVLLAVIGLSIHVGKDFLPELDEGSIWLQVQLPWKRLVEKMFRLQKILLPSMQLRVTSSTRTVRKLKSS